MPDMLKPSEWAAFDDLLIRVADMPLKTWQDKRRELKLQLSQSAWTALKEIAAWDLE